MASWRLDRPAFMRVPVQKAWGLITLLLLVSLACESPTPVAPAESGLTISANPTRIDIDGATEISVLARKADGAAVNAGTEITFTTTLGKLDPTIALTDDRGQARTSLTGDGRVGVATVEASSGAAAAVMLDIQVGAQPTSIGLQANPARLPREGGTARLVAQVLDDLGNPLRNINIRFGTDAGSLESGGSAVLTNAQGEARDTVTLTEFDVSGATDGFFFVTAETVDDTGEPLIADFEMSIGGFASTLNLATDPGTVPPSGGDFLLTATVQDDGGMPLEGATVFFSSDTGSLISRGGGRTTDGDGIAQDTLTLSPLDLEAFPGTSINVFASTLGLGNEEILDTDQILVSTSVGLIILEASLASVATDVTTTVTLTATVFDEFNNPLPDAGVVFLASPTCVAGIVLCGEGTLAGEGQLLVTGLSGQVTTTLTVTSDDVTDGMGLQETASITITVETLILGDTLTDSFTITVVAP